MSMVHLFSGVPIDYGNFEAIYLENRASYGLKNWSNNELLFSPLSNGVCRLFLDLSVAEISPFSRLVRFSGFSPISSDTKLQFY
uniref:hypothetical protein n=1 Tax=Bartonella sp. CL27QHWL TaxID=3243521 RepID=UPI0035D06656